MVWHKQYVYFIQGEKWKFAKGKVTLTPTITFKINLNCLVSLQCKNIEPIKVNKPERYPLEIILKSWKKADEVHHFHSKEYKKLHENKVFMDFITLRRDLEQS